MNKLVLLLAFMLYLIFSTILVFSILGIALVIEDAWMEIGNKLIDGLTK